MGIVVLRRLIWLGGLIKFRALASIAAVVGRLDPENCPSTLALLGGVGLAPSFAMHRIDHHMFSPIRKEYLP